MDAFPAKASIFHEDWRTLYVSPYGWTLRPNFINKLHSNKKITNESTNMLRFKKNYNVHWLKLGINCIPTTYSFNTPPITCHFFLSGNYIIGSSCNVWAILAKYLGPRPPHLLYYWGPRFPDIQPMVSKHWRIHDTLTPTSVWTHLFTVRWKKHCSLYGDSPWQTIINSIVINWAYSMGPQRSPLSRVVVVVVDIDFTLPFTRCRYCHTLPVL